MAKAPTKAESDHMDKVAALGCIACKNIGYDDSPAEIHHISNGAMGKRASNTEVIPLCHIHHRTGGYGVAIHAGKNQWQETYGTEQDLLEQVKVML